MKRNVSSSSGGISPLRIWLHSAIRRYLHLLLLLERDFGTFFCLPITANKVSFTSRANFIALKSIAVVDRALILMRHQGSEWPRQFLGSRIMMLINIHNAPKSINAVFIGHSRDESKDDLLSSSVENERERPWSRLLGLGDELMITIQDHFKVGSKCIPVGLIYRKPLLPIPFFACCDFSSLSLFSPVWHKRARK